MAKTVLLDTPSFKQSRAMCGPACIKIIAAYFGRDISQRHIARACKTSRISGTTGVNLVKGARALGFCARIVDDAGFAEIARWLHRQVPVIVDWTSTAVDRVSRRHMAGGHYAVVCGLGARNIVLQDPAVGHRVTLTRRHFLNVWFDFTYVYPRVRDDLIIRRLIVVVPRDVAVKLSRKGAASRAGPDRAL